MKYRFKTKQEFEKEFGKEWDIELGRTEYGNWCWIDAMNCLFGTALNQDFPDDRKCITLRLPYNNEKVCVTKFMLKEISPSYKPRKIIREI